MTAMQSTRQFLDTYIPNVKEFKRINAKFTETVETTFPVGTPLVYSTADAVYKKWTNTDGKVDAFIIAQELVVGANETIVAKVLIEGDVDTEFIYHEIAEADQAKMLADLTPQTDFVIMDFVGQYKA